MKNRFSLSILFAILLITINLQAQTDCSNTPMVVEYQINDGSWSQSLPLDLTTGDKIQIGIDAYYDQNTNLVNIYSPNSNRGTQPNYYEFENLTVADAGVYTLEHISTGCTTTIQISVDGDDGSGGDPPPGNTLWSQSNSNSDIYFTDGNVGVGTSNPQHKLHVEGDFYLHGDDSYSSGWGKTYFNWRRHSLIMGTPVGTYSHNLIELKPGGSSSGELNSAIEFYHALGEDNHEKRVRISSSETIPTFFNAGNVGIGTTNPGNYELAVNGNIRAKEIKVETGWADYVFTEDYNLPTLEEVAQHIKEKGHLINIPSAAEVEANGIQLGEMNKLLLEKIEELTLYILYQEERLKEQQVQTKSLQQEINNFKKEKHETNKKS